MNNFSFDFKDPSAWKGVALAVLGFLVLIGVVEPDFASELEGEIVTAIGAVFALIAAVMSLLTRNEQ